MKFIPIRYDQVVMHMSEYPKDIVVRVIRTVSKNTNLITPTSARMLSDFLKQKREVSISANKQ